MTRIFPTESPFLVRSRGILKEARDAQKTIEAKEMDQLQKLKRMAMGPDVIEIGKTARDARLNSEKKVLKAIQDDLAKQQEAIENVLQVNAQFERAHTKKVAEVREQYAEKIDIANRRIRSAVRCEALLDAHPEVAPLGPLAIFYKALKEDYAADNKPHSRWKVEQPEDHTPAPPKP